MPKDSEIPIPKSPPPKSPNPAPKPSPPPSPPSTARSKAPPPSPPKSAPDPKKPSTPPPEPPAAQVPPDAEIIDIETFQQILDLDEEASHEFSRGMAWAYFTQAENTFKEMDEALKKKDLGQLSSLGHFLKGSSAALGLFKVQDLCEKIQHYGQRRDEEAHIDLSERVALEKITEILPLVNAEYNTAESWLKQWYEEHPDEESEPESRS